MSRKLASFKELKEAVANGEVKLAKIVVPPLPPPAPSRKTGASSGDTRAGKSVYDEFFSLYAQSLDGCDFWPLGFIPGPALVTYGRDKVVAATEDITRRIGTLPRSVDDLPVEVLRGMIAWSNLSCGLGFQPSSWADGSARRLLSGRKPDTAMVLGMPLFRYRNGDSEMPFGVVLEPSSEGLRVAKVYNPEGLPDAPAEGAVLKFSELKDGRGPILKLLRTQALMESNFASRFNRDGSPREDQRWSR